MGFLGPPINTIELLRLPEAELGWAKQNSLALGRRLPLGKRWWRFWLMSLSGSREVLCRVGPWREGGRERTSPVLVLKDIPILQA